MKNNNKNKKSKPTGRIGTKSRANTTRTTSRNTSTRPTNSRAKVGSSGRTSSGRTAEVRKKIFFPITCDPKVDLDALIRAYGLDYQFADKTLKEADNISQVVTSAQLQGRRDFRGGKVVTIDGEDAKDLDDAVEVERTDFGYRLSVHIADVANYVQVGTSLDKDAYERGTSVYFPNTVLPMLPKKLSNGICSLNPNVDRLVLSCIMDFDREGKRLNEEIVEGVIRTRHRLTYNEVEAIIGSPRHCEEALPTKQSHEKNPTHRIASSAKPPCNDSTPQTIAPDIIDMLKVARELMSILFKKRKARGMIEFDLPESKIELDDEGFVKTIEHKPRLSSHRLIEEFMLAANETVAQLMSNIQAPIICRSHMPPPAEKAEAFEDFLDVLGLKFGRPIIGAVPRDWARFLDKQKLGSSQGDEGVGSSALVEKVALRSMSKASYEPVNTGHFGLAADYYCHFTSPIRRYPDLVTHRVLKEFLHSGKKAVIAKFRAFASDASKISSARERRAEEAERRSHDLKKAEFMRQHLGEEFDGIISGVTDFGIFVELSNSCEGLVRIDDLPKDNYRVDAKVYRITGKKYRYVLGDKVRIRVLSVTADKVGFGIVESEIKEK